MKILKISAGLMPKRSGGVPAYVTELRDELLQRGHQVVYLDTYNQDGARNPQIVQTSSAPDDFAFYNSGALPPWGKFRCAPTSDIRASRQTEKCFMDFVTTVRPDVIHFHELLCFPMELVPRLRSAGYKLLFTTQDYFSVCPTIKLFLPSLHSCTVGADEIRCDRCVRHFTTGRVSPFYRRNQRWIEKLPPILAVMLRRSDTLCGRIVRPFLPTRQGYRLRRLGALKCLQAFDLILCMSRAQHELMQRIAGPLPNMRQIYLSRQTYGEGIQGGASKTDGKTRFVALNLNEVSKGRDLLLKEFAELRVELDSVELHMYGEPADNQPGVFFHGTYAASDLKSILASMDAGIVPSIWEEAYGYVGPEMLTHGLPVIASAAGAMKEYVIPGVNGLIFDSSKAGSLKGYMKMLAMDKTLLSKLRANASLSKIGIIYFARHVDQIEAIYHEVTETNPRLSDTTLLK